MSLRLGRFNHKHYYPMKKKSAFHSVRRTLHQGGFFTLRVLIRRPALLRGSDDCAACPWESLSTTTHAGRAVAICKRTVSL